MSKMFYNIRQQELNISIPTPVVANSIDYVEVYGSFSSDWNDAVKTVFFNQGDVTYKIIMRDNAISKDKHLNLGKGSWNTWVMGDIYNSAGTIISRITTHVLNFTVLESGYIDDNIIYVEPDVGEQILTIAQAALEAAQEAEKRAQSVVDAAKRGDFDGAAGGEGKQGEKGEQGEAGKDGVNAVITGATASVTQSVGNARVDILTKGTPSERSFEFYFSGIKGEKGQQGEAFRIKGYVATVDDLPVNPTNGDVYGVGTEAPYEIYIYDEGTGWVDNGQIQGPKGDAAVISSASAELKSTKVADPELNFVMGGTESDRTFKFTFDGLQGEQGESGVYVGSGEVPEGTKVWVNPEGTIITEIKTVEILPNSGAHNSIYRGKNLGTSVTEAQYAAIKAGTFEDLYIGDYWVINGVNWRIAAFDYYWNTGKGQIVGICTTHHVTIVPDTAIDKQMMNSTNTTTGAYANSKMYTEGLATAKTKIAAAFGEAHILSHELNLANAVSASGLPTGRAWYESTVELMTEQNVYGCKIHSVAGAYANNEVDKTQYPLFAHNPYLICNRAWYWLRDTVSAAAFAYIDVTGTTSAYNASVSAGVRPAFSIIG